MDCWTPVPLRIWSSLKISFVSPNFPSTHPRASKAGSSTMLLVMTPRIMNVKLSIRIVPNRLASFTCAWVYELGISSVLVTRNPVV